MVTTYVALGDSFTAGNGIGEGRRWADLLAAELGTGRPGFRYVNLACDGADSRAVLDTIAPATALRPDLVTLICGANDVLLRPRPDLDGFRERFDLILRRLREDLPDAAILTSTYPDGWGRSRLGPRTRRRISKGIRTLNQTILETAATRGVVCLDARSHPGAHLPDNFAADGLHPSITGHRRIAREYAGLLKERFGIITGRRHVIA